jgi:hypothetical protein
VALNDKKESKNKKAPDFSEALFSNVVKLIP